MVVKYGITLWKYRPDDELSMLYQLMALRTTSALNMKPEINDVPYDVDHECFC